jgi:hypothetical protein
MTLKLAALASQKVKTGFLSSSIISLADIAQAFLDTAKGTPLQVLAEAKPVKFGEQDGFAVTLFPNARPFMLSAMNNHVLFGGYTDISGGPGYHAFLVAALDTVQGKLGLHWRTQPQVDDETGYFHNRNFAGLQLTMAQHFKAKCREIAKAADDTSLIAGANIFADAVIETHGNEVATRMGFRTVDQLRHWATLEGSELLSAAAGYFPWWNQPFDGDFYSGLALSLIWLDLRWAKPLDDGERRVLPKALSWLNEAVRLGTTPPVSVEVASELMEMVSQNAPDFPRAEGIGFRRRRFLRPLGDWTIKIPGSLLQSRDETGAIVFRNAVFNGHAALGVLKPGSDPEAKVLAPGEVERKRGFFPSDDGNGFQLEAVVRTPSANGPDRLCLLKIWMADEKLRKHADAIVDSVYLAKT